MDFGSTIAESVESPERAVSSLVLECITADYDLPLDAIRPLDLLNQARWPAREPPEPEYPPIAIMAAGLGFFGLAGILRAVPLLLQRFEARRHPRRRRVKIEIRMMA